MVGTVAAQTQDDMGTGGDAGDDFYSATLISPAAGTGYLDATDTADWYKVEVTAGQTVSVSMTPSFEADFDLELYGPDQAYLGSSAHGGSQTEAVHGTVTSSGYAYIYVKRCSGEGTYSLAITSTAQDDMGTGGDAGDNFSAATLVIPSTGTGYLDSRDTADWYKVQVTAGQLVSVSMTPSFGADFDLELYGSDQAYLGSSAHGGSQPEAAHGTVTSSGYAYIFVKRFADEGTYSLTVTVATQDDMGTGGDAGDNFGAATLVIPSTGTGYLDSRDTADWYKVQVTAGQLVSVSMTPSFEADFDLELYGPNQAYLGSSAHGGSQPEAAHGTASSSGYVYVFVKRFAGEGTYALTITGTTQDDMGTGGDAGDNFGAATLVTPSTGTGYLGSVDKADWYKIQVTADQIVSVSMTPSFGADFDLELYGPDQAYLGSSAHGGSVTDTAQGTVTSSGYAYIFVEWFAGEGTYSLTITGTTQDDMGTGGDAGDNFGAATAITSGSGTGYLSSRDTADWYKVQAPADRTISVSMTPSFGADFDLWLYGPDQSRLDSSAHGGSQTDTVEGTIASSGYVYIYVERFTGDGTYSLNVSVATGGEAESAHPYANNLDKTWTISRPGAGKIRAHFAQLETERGWDYVYVYDANDNLIESYTGSYRDFWTSWMNGSTIKIRLVTDGSFTAYGFTVDNVEAGAAAPVTPSNKVAVIVGINDYQNLRMSGMRYCINDAIAWKGYLVGRGYTISSFLTDNQATEANIQSAITKAAAEAGSDGTLVLIFSGHCIGIDATRAFVCYDAGTLSVTTLPEVSGYLSGPELQNLLSGHDGRLFAFFDSSLSGGIGQLVTSTKRYVVTACTNVGYRYDDALHGHGALTYWFLKEGLINQGFTNAEEAFNWVSARYPYTGANAAQQFDGDPTSSFSLDS